jgi:dihydrofolate reductase
VTLSLIVAMAKNRAIGIGNRMPWHLPADFAYFRQTTMGHPVIMGRKTFDSIGRPLPGRRNLVISRNPDFRAAGVELVHSLDEALNMTRDDEPFVIGGATLYTEALPHAQRIHVTEVDATPEADTYFPVLDMNQWCEVSRQHHPADEKNAHGMAFVVFDRK